MALFGTEKIKIIGKEHSHRFVEARKREWEGWKNYGTFIIIKIKDVPSGIRIYGLRFFDCGRTNI